jgi:hypothetical protein
MIKSEGDLIRVRITEVGPDGDASVGKCEEWAREDIRQFKD